MGEAKNALLASLEDEDARNEGVSGFAGRFDEELRVVLISVRHKLIDALRDGEYEEAMAEARRLPVLLAQQIEDMLSRSRE